MQNQKDSERDEYEKLGMFLDPVISLEIIKLFEPINDLQNLDHVIPNILIEICLKTIDYAK